MLKLENIQDLDGIIAIDVWIEGLLKAGKTLPKSATVIWC